MQHQVAPRYQAQLQQQHQEVDQSQDPAPAETEAPAPKGSGKERASLEDRVARAVARKESRLGGDDAERPKQSSESTSERTRQSKTEKPGSEQSKPDDSDSEKAPQNKPSEASLEEAGKAFEAGDFRKLARLLGKDEKIADGAGEKLSVIRRQRQRLTRREKAADEREAKLNTERMALQRDFGDPAAAKKAYEAGQYHVAAQYCQRIFGDDFAKITQNIARQTSGMSPEKLKELQERDNLERENKRLKAEKEERERSGKKQAQRSDALKVIDEKCAGHDVMKLKDANELIMRELEAHWDGQRITIGYKEAADNVLGRYRDAAKSLGFYADQQAPEKKPAAKAPEKREPAKPMPRRQASGSAVDVRTTKDGKKSYRPQEDRIAAALRRSERLRGL